MNNPIAILDFYVKNSLAHTGVNYDEKLNHLLFFANKPLSIDTITDYCTYRQLQCVKNATINRELTLLRSAVNFYNKHYDTQIKNPLNGFKLFESDFMPRYLSEQECQSLLTHAKGYHNPKLYHFINLLLNTGCRYGELIKLQWDSVDLDNGHLTIRNSLSKNRKTVHKPLNANALQSLQALKKGNNSKWVFYNEKTMTHYVNFRKGFKNVLEKADLGHIRLHDLRHTFASLLVKRGVPLYYIMQLLGHSDIKTTQRYAHLGQNTLADVVQILPKFD